MERELIERCTNTTASRAAMARTSAHETVYGHASSTKYLILSITSNPRSEFRLGPACFSLTMSPKVSRRRDASHPCSK